MALSWKKENFFYLNNIIRNPFALDVCDFFFTFEVHFLGVPLTSLHHRSSLRGCSKKLSSQKEEAQWTLSKNIHPKSIISTNIILLTCMLKPSKQL